HAHDQTGNQQRPADLEGDHERVLRRINRELLVHEKLVTRERMIRCQPSAITNSRSLNGNEMLAGGSIIMPIDMSTLETTMSITRKGTMIRKPIWKAVLSSLIMKAGIKAYVGTSACVLGCGRPPTWRNSARSRSRTCLNMNSRRGWLPLSK